MLFFTANVGLLPGRSEDIFLCRCFFVGVSFPALHTISLSPNHDSWSDYRAIAQFSNILQSAPNVSFGLHLLLSFDYFPFYFDEDTGSYDDVRPVWLSLLISSI
ncbi:hypothetical protein BDN70DRAFT_701600 [Pholiota conissans]|uniref:Uncharacterized protein n=1 Tax=Pholiota conissans TaxID=109636 RepID=A0A9P5Z0N4_9AGAR|nr:hypothetical protein BDN70DRAFT_701600 [Pholiota conissans]